MNSSKLVRRAPKSLQRGISLVQVAFIIGISAILVVFAAIYGPRYFNKAKVQNEVSALTDFRANVVSYGSRVGVFTNANVALTALTAQNFFPASQVSNAGATVVNQWGGQYSTALGPGIANAGDSLQLTSTGIPDAACTELGTSLDGIANVIAINGTAVKANGAQSDPAAAATACGGANADNNSMVLTIAR